MKWTIIHHIIPIKKGGTDDISNLMPMFPSSHTTHHMIGNKYGVQNKGDRICFECKSKTTYKTKKGYETWGKDSNNNWLCSKCYGNVRREIFRRTGSWTTNKFK